MEAALLPILSGMGLPVPEVLAGPVIDPDSRDSTSTAVYSFLSGMNLQELSESSPDGCRLAMELVVQGAQKLAALTPQLRAAAEVRFLRTITLSQEVEMLIQSGGPWSGEPLFATAVGTLRTVLKEVQDSPVFTGGDYQPANFLTDGEKLTGFVDFENACYQDFLFGFAKYPIYDLHPLNRAGFVPFLLERMEIDPRQFDIRVALGCLKILQREIGVSGGEDRYREHVMQLLTGTLNSIP